MGKCGVIARKSHIFSLYQKHSVTPEYAKNAFAAGDPPRTPLGDTRYPYRIPLGAEDLAPRSSHVARVIKSKKIFTLYYEFV